jgi:MFS family permease
LDFNRGVSLAASGFEVVHDAACRINGKHSGADESAVSVQNEFSVTKSGTLQSNDTLAEFFGVPHRLGAAYVAFILDATAVGLAAPVFPFFVTELGANAFQLSVLISVNFLSQMLGCVWMGRVSDRYGRKRAFQISLIISFTSYVLMGQSRTLLAVLIARILAGSSGGLVPILQSAVLDVAGARDRPKYIGMIQAAFGLGFIAGPILAFLMPDITMSQKLQLCAVFHVLALIITTAFFRNTNDRIGTVASTEHTHGYIAAPPSSSQPTSSIIPFYRRPLFPIIVNAFALMFAFATEGIYAMLFKDSFGLRDRSLAELFAFCGLVVMVMQRFLMKPLIAWLGGRETLMLGNLLLSLGMVGIALLRGARLLPLHLLAFALHVVGYSIADTSLVSILSDLSHKASAGKDLALNQAVQAGARILSPLVAGFLYQYGAAAIIDNAHDIPTHDGVLSRLYAINRISKNALAALPVGALPYLAAAAFPLLGIGVLKAMA